MYFVRKKLNVLIWGVIINFNIMLNIGRLKIKI